MNCWKTIRITHDFGTVRLMIYSGCTMLFSFLIYYLLISSIMKTPELTSVSFPIIVSSILAIVIIHKLLHLLPIWLCGKKANLQIGWLHCLPVTTIRFTKPLSKNLYLIALVMPFLIITSAGAIISILYPMYIAYISILTSIHFGLVFFDLVYALYVIKAPKRCLVEKHREEFHILLKQY